MKRSIIYVFSASMLLMASFTLQQKNTKQATPATASKPEEEFQFVSERFADLRILKYQVPGFETLTAKQKELLYYLYEAARSGRDIIWDQNCRYNLTIRHTLEAIIKVHDKNDQSDSWKNFMEYTKCVWFSNGIHHHYGHMKIMPNFPKDYFVALIKQVPSKDLPLAPGENADGFTERINKVIFDPAFLSKKVSKDPNQDMIQSSATGFYSGVTQKDVTDFYNAKINNADATPPMYGLNSRIEKNNDIIIENLWKVGGLYSPAIEKIVYWLQKASVVSENASQKKALDLLIEYYKTGDLKKFDNYSITWTADTASRIDVVNGFIEVYNDPLGYKGSFESVVSIKDMEATKRIATIGSNAQWFENNSPIAMEHKKKNVKGISAKVITVVTESGDASPSTPIGINLPNSNWIRENHGSKSVNMGNIVNAYNKAQGEGTLKEFFYSDEMIERSKKFGSLSNNLETDLHEVIGHASGQLNPGVGEPHQSLKNYASTMEEARADLVGLHFLMDQKLIDIGVMPTTDVGKAQYDYYIMNGLMLQLRRIKPGEQIEEDHMRNRQMVARWCLEQGAADNVIEKKMKDNKTYYVINDYTKLRALFGRLLRDLQRIKSEGDYQTAHDLVETYGVKVDSALQTEVLERFKSLNTAPYNGFINPKLVPVMKDGKIVDVKLEYPTNFTEQMLEYGDKYSLLPVTN